MALVEKIAVKFNKDDEISDGEIAIAVLNALTTNSAISIDNIQAEVETGHVTLDGELQWNRQKETFQRWTSNPAGIKVLTNNIKIIANNPDQIEKTGI